MNFVRKIADSNILANVIDIPENLKNRTVEILIFPYENQKNIKESIDPKPKRAKGSLAKYRNPELQKLENEAWVKAAVDKHENS
ncbi:MAG TPA: hypothetical protein DDY59_06530 [Lachnospiraceae bacterium]|jgi:hypothetical protein|nr:hypothetical protein [Lachnospiraceae bacterium]